MKVLFNCSVPFMLAHGGMQIQLEQTKAALEKIGVQTEFFRWWDSQQDGDILHQFGALPLATVEAAHSKGWKVVMTLLLTEPCNRSASELLLRKCAVRSVLAAPLPEKFKNQLPWRSFLNTDKIIVGLHAERTVLQKVYGAPEKLLSVVPCGLSEAFLKAPTALRNEDHLISHGRIGPTKNSIETAELAHAAQVPILFVGKPFDKGSDYWRRFAALIDNRYVKHAEHLTTESEIIEQLRRARGYVLMSRFENWSLAAHEAVACGLPLLVPDQPWSRERFGNGASYFPKRRGPGSVAALQRFYEECPRLSPPRIKLHSWMEVAEMVRAVYEKILR